LGSLLPRVLKKLKKNNNNNNNKRKKTVRNLKQTV